MARDWLQKLTGGLFLNSFEKQTLCKSTAFCCLGLASFEEGIDGNIEIVSKCEYDFEDISQFVTVVSASKLIQFFEKLLFQKFNELSAIGDFAADAGFAVLFNDFRDAIPDELVIGDDHSCSSGVANSPRAKYSIVPV